MTSELEAALRARVRRGELPRVVVADWMHRGVIASPKQVWRTLEKWARRGEYSYGVTLDLGWLTEKAP